MNVCTLDVLTTSLQRTEAKYWEETLIILFCTVGDTTFCPDLNPSLSGAST